MKRICVILSLILATLNLAGCAELKALLATPTATSTLQLTIAWTPAPTDTPTPVPSLTPSPTPTLAPCPTVPGQHACASDVVISSSPSTKIIVRVRYLLYLPGDYGKDPDKKWPLILFLHGSGGIGSDLSLLKRGPLPQWLDTKTDFPFIVVSPQLPGVGPSGASQYTTSVSYWSLLIEPINGLLDQIPAHYAVDTHRLYLTGLSLGGFGAWEFALRYPQRFAAIVPIAGGYLYQSEAIPSSICSLKDLPVWVFHGALDSSVDPNQSESLVNALIACGGNVRFTLYPEAGHSGAWNTAYADPELWNWLLEQTLR